MQDWQCQTDEQPPCMQLQHVQCHVKHLPQGRPTNTQGMLEVWQPL